jgi:hypothetical protein
MTIDDDRSEADVPEQAVQALAAAQRRARQAGHTLVQVQDGKLVRIQGQTVTVLKRVPGRKRVRVVPRPAE